AGTGGGDRGRVRPWSQQRTSGCQRWRSRGCHGTDRAADPGHTHHTNEKLVARLFGTDGVRGVANLDLTPELALRLGRAAGHVLGGGGHAVVVGRDTRRSVRMLDSAVVAGLCSVGLLVRFVVQILPPGLASPA